MTSVTNIIARCRHCSINWLISTILRRWSNLLPRATSYLVMSSKNSIPNMWLARTRPAIRPPSTRHPICTRGWTCPLPQPAYRCCAHTPDWLDPRPPTQPPDQSSAVLCGQSRHFRAYLPAKSLSRRFAIDYDRCHFAICDQAVGRFQEGQETMRMPDQLKPCTQHSAL